LLSNLLENSGPSVAGDVAVVLHLVFSLHRPAPGAEGWWSRSKGGRSWVASQQCTKPC
jgi:hypothetical protein